MEQVFDEGKYEEKGDGKGRCEEWWWMNDSTKLFIQIIHQNLAQSGHLENISVNLFHWVSNE